MLVKLRSIGFLEPAAAYAVAGAAAPMILDRPCMLVYAGEFESADGPVSVTPEMLILLVSRFNARHDRLAKLSPDGAVALKQCPPIQLDHSTSARDTVGRLVGKLILGTTTLEDGSTTAAVFGTMRVLGADNCERVNDGRWSRLSVGADFEQGRLQELSIVPFPAAAEAALLSAAGDEDTENNTPPEKEVAMDPEKRAKLKAYLMGVKGLSEADADAKLSQLEGEDDSMTAMAAECDAHEAKLAADAETETARLAAEKVEDDAKKTAELAAAAATEKETRLTIARAKLTELSGAFNTLVASSRLAATTGRIMTKLSRLRASAKITPAEIKKLDLKALAAADEKALEMVLATYEAREPVLFVGQLGSIRATSLAAMQAGKAARKAKQSRAQLEAETRRNMSLLAAKDKHDSEEGGDEKTPSDKGGDNEGGGKAPPFAKKSDAGDDADNTGDETAQNGTGVDDGNGDSDLEGAQIDPADQVFFDREYAQICTMMRDGKINDAALKLKEFMAKCLGQAGVMPSVEQVEINADETEKQLAALAGNVSAMQDKFTDLSKFAGELLA